LATATSTRSRGDVVGGILAAAASLQFGAIVVLGKRVLERGMTVEAMLAFRFGVAAVLLAIALILLRRPLRAASGERIGLALLAVFGYAVEATFFFTAARRRPPAAGGRELLK
jgi:drug/metabolite transporter (DMT)-like permease